MATHAQPVTPATASILTMTSGAPLSSETSLLTSEGWSILVAQEIGSTNSAAAKLPPWHAVRSRLQTDGRGRTGRFWVSDEGGLWLSAVVPCPGNRARWAILPLAAGWAIIAALKELGAAGLRLRWPNDIMVGRRKLAGLLVERFNDETAVIGIGLNVFNFPEAAEPALAGSTARLADLAPGGYTLDDITRVILRAIGRAHAHIRNDEFRTIVDQLNVHWAQPRLVSVTLTGRAHTFTGLFHGIDETGRLRITTERFGHRAYDPSQVTLLRELE